LAGEYVDGAILLNGNGKETLTAICALILRRQSKWCR
jgi:hypothetical protein